VGSLRVFLLRAALGLLRRVERHPQRARAVAIGTLALVLVLGRGCVPAPLTLATYNLRHFGAEPKDQGKLRASVGGLGADLVAVQEVRDPAALDRLASELSGLRRAYQAVSSGCGGRRGMHVGFLYDTRRMTLLQTREFRELLPEEGGCSEGDRPGLLGVFEADGQPLHALVVHLKAGGSDGDFRERKAQYERLQRLLGLLRAEGARRVVLLGDLNTTGFLGNERRERELVEALARGGGLEVATTPLRCTEYYRKDERTMEPSLLDHALVSEGALEPGSVEVHSHCRELACAPRAPGAMPPSYAGVSDHCPVTLRLLR
jgi:endonuclease/exonuclease/phosphatase family metal-dependent hydrolase